VNEDAYACASGATAFAVVADGTGGASSGRIAADAVVEEVRAAFRDREALVESTLARAWWRREHAGGVRFEAVAPDERRELLGRVRLLLGRALRPETPGDLAVLADAQKALFALLARAFVDVDVRIHEAQARNERLRGMGATAVAGIFDGAAVGLAHCGDARVYRLREGTLRQLTEDHTLAAEASARGVHVPDTVDAASIVVRALGTAPPVAVDGLRFDAREGDVFLFATRGAFLGVPEEAIAAALGGHARAPEAACAAVVRAALATSPSENVTAAVVSVTTGA